MLRGDGHGAAHQDDARVQERHQAELHHKVGGGRERESGDVLKQRVKATILQGERKWEKVREEEKKSLRHL